MHTRRLIQPYHVRFPMRTARSYKKVPGLTERCKELAAFLKVASNPLPQPPSVSEIPYRIQQRIYRGRTIGLIRCTHCGEPEVPYASRNGSYSNGICRDCAPLFAQTEDGLYILRERGWTDYNGTLWSSEEAFEQTCAEADDDDDNDDDDDDRIAEYHSHPDRSNKMRFHEPDDDDPWAKDVIHIGFEWEYNSTSSSRRFIDFKSLDRTEFCFGETDGSLSSARGLEVVTGWSTLGTVCRWATEIGDLIKVGDIEDAGLHVNISGLTNLQTAKLITFLSHNYGLTTTIGGRRNVGYARAQNDSLQNWLRGTRKYNSAPVGSICPITDKYSVCNVRGGGYSNPGVAEIRIFNSSDKAEKIVYRIQYAWLAAQFVRQPGLDLSERNFKQFLADNPWAVKGARDLLKAFPVLCPAAFAKRPKKVPA